MPKQWRELVYEYGAQAVIDLHYYANADYDDASDMLWLMRSARQAAWLATDYITPKAKRNYF
jgi:hypothetical protein